MNPRGFPVGEANLVRAHPWVGAAVAKPKDARVGEIEREDILGPTRRTLPCSVGCTAPQQARGPQAAAGALSLDRPGGSGTETTTATPEPRVEQVPHGVAEHV